ncbi:MAG TPA: DegV family protein [Ruminococcus sp.]|nr:DegV family protein [Ruminococcus sp.]HCR74614.1 DegV family protein [Ruminococcus sp.]
MQKIKLITDSASDIPAEKAKELNIKVIPFPVTVDGKSYLEGENITKDEFFTLLDSTESLPSTAQITFPQFTEIFEQYYNEGYTELIYISISSNGSATYSNAERAKDEFFEEHPEACGRMNIHTVNSYGYTGIYGYASIIAGEMIQKGNTAEEILSYLHEWFESAELYFAPYTLKYVKRSGRLSAAAAFAGELLGLRPIIQLIDGVSNVPSKVRGDKNIAPKLVQITKDRIIKGSPYIIITGSVPEYSAELEKQLTENLGYPPVWNYKIGATIASHAGHKVAGVIFKGEKRNHSES